MQIRLAILVLLIALFGCDKDSSRESGSEANALASVDKDGNVVMTTGDGRKLFGVYKKSEVSQSYAVLLLHQEDSNLHEYAPIIDSLHQGGFDTFQVDLRFGGDKYGKANRTIELNNDKLSTGANLDMMAALDWLRAEMVEKIYVTGSGKSAALAISIAAGVHGIATFSPDNDLDNVDLKKSAGNIKKPFFMTQTPTEDGVENLFENVPEASNFVRYFPKRGVRGADSLNSDLNPLGFEAMRENYLRFLVKSASGEIKPTAEK